MRFVGWVYFIGGRRGMQIKMIGIKEFEDLLEKGMKGLSIGYNRRRDRKELKIGFKSRSYVLSGNRKNPSYILMTFHIS